MYGANGVLFDVDLTERTVERVPMDPEDVRRFGGGSGVACAMMMRERDPATIDPMGPENTMYFIVGTLVSTGAPVTPKLLVSARSPLTGIWGEAAGGGTFPALLKNCGIDGFIVRGVASSPVYFVVDEDGLTIHDADDVWGLDTFETHDLLLARHGKRGRACSIGPAGERGVRFASIMLDGEDARAAGRCGMGTVMGSKNLKAVYASGRKKPELFDRPALKASVKEERADILAATKGLTDWSTAGGVEAVEYHGDLPVKNWQLGSWKEGAQKIAGQTFMTKFPTKHGTCNLCPVRCHKRVDIDPPEEGRKPKYSHGPEYETLAGFGSNLLIDRPEDIILGNQIANRLGMDTISAAGVIGFAFEMYDRGLITDQDTNGLALTWGSGEALTTLLTRIGNRDGDLATLLGEGSKRAAASFGGEAHKYTIEVKGLELPYHDPRAHVSMAPNYATASRGACHLDSLTYFIGRGVPAPDLGYTEPFKDHDSNKEMAELCYTAQNYLAMFNPLGLCKFLFLGRAGPTLLAHWLNLATGLEMDRDGFMETGERILQLKRLYSVRCGVTKKDDTLPHRLLNEAQPDGMAAGVLPNLDLMLTELYRLRGWDDDGIPTAETVERFGLQEFVLDA